MKTPTLRASCGRRAPSFPRPLRRAWLAGLLVLASGLPAARAGASGDLAAAFREPPESARPWVYWYFMDGNLTREGMTADLEAMKRAGIGGGLFLEVNVGVPRGPVEFMSPAWRELFTHAVAEADRLGLQIALGSGPGWCGTGGPWVPPERSMQHLVSVATNLTGPSMFEGRLPDPAPRAPFFGERTLTPELKAQWQSFRRDVAVLAFPTPAEGARIADLDEKALYFRAPYSSQPGVKPYLPMPDEFPAAEAAQCVAREGVVDLTSKLTPEGQFAWAVPPGSWTVVRFARTSTGQITRPAPAPGLGFECDKFSAPALDAHFEAFVGTLVKGLAPKRNPQAGLTTLHFDSWEMSSQNWSEAFREDFLRLRGYDLLRFLPVLAGKVVDSPEISERFLWDLRQTAQELVIANHAARLRELGGKHGLVFSLEPYDLNPCADLALGGVADIPQCEFWSKDHGFKTAFSCIEAVSIAHTMGRAVVAAESFTAGPGEDWKLYPGALKVQADWALCAGINRMIFHTFQHQPWLDRWPGMAMGPYGVHWQRTQPWWEMSSAFHRYLARCQHVLSRGTPVADILYLTPEGAPMVFRPPPSALAGDDWMPDRRGYAFDGCDPAALIARAKVRADGRIAFDGGAAYRVLVLPDAPAMTPALLAKVKDLLADGATVMGPRPLRAPGLSSYPGCDAEVRRLADEVWGAGSAGAAPAERRVGKGTLIATARPERAVPPEAASGRLPGSAAQWIWSSEGEPAQAAAPCTRHFRRTFVLAAGERVSSAWLTASADNSFVARVNGRKAGDGDNFHHARAFDVARHLVPGTNVISIVAVNGGDEANPAGLVATLDLAFVGGGARALHTDGAWEVSARGAAGPWAAARSLGPLGMAPWGALTAAPAPVAVSSLYGPYDDVAALLAARGLPQDFEADRTLRYIHRQVDGADVYFVANPDDVAAKAVCRFRAGGSHAAVWDPLTGRIVAVESAREADGRARVDLTLEGRGSAFVVFTAAPDPAAEKGVAWAPDLRPCSTIEGPWEVTFQSARGAPEKVVLPSLVAWNEHADEGVRHFSGTAVYRKKFAIPNLKPGATARYLDLGRVEVMARVKLNGRDLGVVWTSPFRVDLGPALREGDNELEIEVANLWPNRLIGDQALPQEKRISWTTWNPYKKDSPLLPSGLIGPVQLLEPVR